MKKRNTGNRKAELDALQRRLREALDECARLREENARLRSMLGMPADAAAAIAGDLSRSAPSFSLRPGDSSTPHAAQRSAPSRGMQLALPLPPVPVQAAATGAPSTPEEKIALFRSLFRGREDVYAVRWEGKNGRAGYSPACANEWEPGICFKPQVKCAECPHRAFRPLNDEVIRDHLTGRRTVGIYPLLTNETCWFLAADFDKATWLEDASAFLRTCDELGVPAYLERSRSGNGGHVWIFFDRPVSARLARQLGSAILTRTMDRRHEIGLDSYDRFFPNQDTLPKGGFGNLIALPLQRAPRKRGNSVFVDRDGQPYPDQWAFLASVRRMPAEGVEALVREAARAGGVLGVRVSTGEEDEEDPWTLPPSGRKPERPIEGPLPERVRLVRSNLVYVEKQGLPPALINRLIRLAAFQNPEFYRAQAMRRPTFGKPRIISCAEDFARHIGLPRGCFDDVLDLLQAQGVEADVVDERFPGQPLDVTFHGELRPLQREAAASLLAHDIGVLAATTAFGKTVVGAWLIAARRVNTLVLVHRRQLLDQWRERLSTFLGIPPRSIGVIGGGQNRPTGRVDVALIQSLAHKGEVRDRVAEYGQVIVDECHHVPAVRFEQVLKQVRARYVVGLTATPVRRDGHHPIILMQCGPIRFRVSPKVEAAGRSVRHVVLPRVTAFRLPPEAGEPGIQAIYRALVRDEARNELIVADVLQAVRDGRVPLLLTERAEHLDYFATRLRAEVHHVIVLRGGMGARQRAAAAEALASVREGESRVLLATGRYIGEGFDDPRLDTLFLALPVSWRGTLQQYAGRLHRVHHDKQVVQIYDYVDVHVPVLARMYEKRLKGYRAMGYEIEAGGCSEQDPAG